MPNPARTDMMTASIFCYVPSLHPELLKRQLSGLCTLWPGISTAPVEQTIRPIHYPFSPDQAARLLADLVQVAEDSGTSSAPVVERETLPPDEAQALARLAHSGDAFDMARSALEAAHKTILLAWNLEERLLEIEALRNRVGFAWDKLQAELGEAGDEGHARAEELFPGMNPERLLAALNRPAPFPWKAVVAAQAAFLPEEAILVADLPEIRSELLERGMLQPLPGDMAENLDWPDRDAILWARLPLSRVLLEGPAGPARPWLDTARDILVLPAGEA